MPLEFYRIRSVFVLSTGLHNLLRLVRSTHDQKKPNGQLVPGGVDCAGRPARFGTSWPQGLINTLMSRAGLFHFARGIFRRRHQSLGAGVFVNFRHITIEDQQDNFTKLKRRFLQIGFDVVGKSANMLHYIACLLKVSLSIDLGHIRFAMAQDNLGCFKPVLGANLCGGRVS